MFKRKQIEDHLLTLARTIDTKDAGWLDSEAFMDFMSGWRELAHYYEQNDDATLDARVLKEYMRFAALLRRISSDDRLSLRRRHQAKTTLVDLCHQLDAVSSASV
jgi:hypothetical protein